MKTCTKFLFCILTAIISCIAGASDSSAVTDPVPLPIDARIRTVMYNPNEVYPFVAHYGFQSFIEFSKEEKILTVSIGNSVSWQVVPSGYRLFLKPVQQDATTNMTVVTNERTYFFELYGKETENIRDPKMVFALRFQYPDAQALAVRGTMDTVPDPDLEEPGRYNFKYSITGPDSIAPIRIFDDGEFTYFEFRDKNAEVPAFFLVDSEGKEGIINYRTRGNYIVVERVSPRFTLRNGPDVVCVYNDNMPFTAAGAPGAPRKPGTPAPAASEEGEKEKEKAPPPMPKELPEPPKETPAEPAKDKE